MLEIGAGSGYQTAVLAKVAGQVYSIERIADLAREAQTRIRQLGIYNATVKCFDGTLGWAANAPYDAILVAAGGPTIPEPLVAQLKIGGRLVVPVGRSRESQRLVRVIKTETGYKQEDHGGCAFVPLIGQHGWSARSSRLDNHGIDYRTVSSTEGLSQSQGDYRDAARQGRHLCLLWS